MEYFYFDMIWYNIEIALIFYLVMYSTAYLNYCVTMRFKKS